MERVSCDVLPELEAGELVFASSNSNSERTMSGLPLPGSLKAQVFHSTIMAKLGELLIPRLSRRRRSGFFFASSMKTWRSDRGSGQTNRLTKETKHSPKTAEKHGSYLQTALILACKTNYYVPNTAGRSIVSIARLVLLIHTKPKTGKTI